MPTIPERLETATESIEANQALLASIVNGAPTAPNVTVSGGSVRVISGVIADGQAAIAASVGSMASAVASSAASATSAAGSATTAGTYATNANTYAGNASTSATAAAGSATTATTQATNAGNSATAAATSAATATTQAGIATTQATNSSNSATAAAGSATTATTQATNSSNSATAAAGSATAAATSATNAAASASAAATSASQAAAVSGSGNGAYGIHSAITNVDTITATTATAIIIQAGSGNNDIRLTPTGTGISRIYQVAGNAAVYVDAESTAIGRINSSAGLAFNINTGTSYKFEVNATAFATMTSTGLTVSVATAATDSTAGALVVGAGKFAVSGANGNVYTLGGYTLASGSKVQWATQTNITGIDGSYLSFSANASEQFRVAVAAVTVSTALTVAANSTFTNATASADTNITINGSSTGTGGGAYTFYNSTSSSGIFAGVYMQQATVTKWFAGVQNNYNGAAYTIHEVVANINALGIAAGTGNAVFGANLAVTGTTAHTGNVAIGTSTAASIALLVRTASTLTGTSQFGIRSDSTFASSATTVGAASYSWLQTAATAFTMATGIGHWIDTPAVGAGSTVTNLYGLKIENQSGGGTNYAIFSGTGRVYHNDTTAATDYTAGAFCINGKFAISGSTGDFYSASSFTVAGNGTVSGNQLAVGNAIATGYVNLQVTNSNAAGTTANVQSTVYNGAYKTGMEMPGQAYTTVGPRAANKGYIYSDGAQGLRIHAINNAMDFWTGNAGAVALTLSTAQLATFAASVTVTTGFGCNGKSAQTAFASGGAAGATATNNGWGFVSSAELTAHVTLVTNIRLALVANGIMS